MLAVAYVAFLCGIEVWAGRLNKIALGYSAKSAMFDGVANVWRAASQKSAIEADRARQTVEQLREGKIPDKMSPGQVDLLRSLDVDPKVTPEFRAKRREQISKLEDSTRAMQERNAALFRGWAEDNARLAAKYEHARWHPWLAVEPDPPLPSTQ